MRVRVRPTNPYEVERGRITKPTRVRVRHTKPTRVRVRHTKPTRVREG